MGLTERRAQTDPPQSEARVRARSELVDTVARESGVSDDRILNAFARVPRHLFVPPNENDSAYSDVALPIGFRQTISQPSMIAIMLAALEIKPNDRVLEVGGGSGYAAALMAELGAEVFTLEIVPELAERAAECLDALGYQRVHVIEANGRQGLPEHAPYDVVLVSAAAADVPDELIRELAPGGRIAIPVGGSEEQELLIGHKHSSGEVHWQRSVPCVFVPLVGKA